MILLIAHTDDLHVNRIEYELQKRKADFIRFDTSFFPSQVKIDMSLLNGIFDGYLMINGKNYEFNKIKSAFFKEIKSLDSIRGKHSVNKSEYIISESQESLYSLWQSLTINNCIWMNDPIKMILFSNKFNQLRIAEQIGFMVPNTIISNIKSTAEEFIFSSKHQTITKLLNSGTVVMDDNGHYYGIPTSLIEREKFDKYSNILDEVPYCFQEYVEKGIDLRITVVGDRVFPVEILSAEVDWRIDDIENIPHKRHNLPHEIQIMCIELLNKIGYKYGAIDMIKNKNGDYYFLEVNSVPAWAWIEDKTGFKICSAICDELNK